MRWSGQEVQAEQTAALPGLTRAAGLIRSVRTPEFAGITFHEVLAKSALNHVPGVGADMPYGWTINPYRGCSHACVYCFARPTHRYLDFVDAGDFDREVVVKVNLVEVLRGELRRASWTGSVVALGTNTDPYQRAEGRYALMPGVIEALAESGTPFSVLTKGTLLRRDIPALVSAAKRVPVRVSMSIAVYDETLQQSVEPGTPTAAARLATVRAVRDAGLECGVLLMPVLPCLTDSNEHLDAALDRIRAAGASTVQWSALHLKPGVRQWYLAWLHELYPQHEQAYRRLYGDGAYAPKAYRAWLSARIRPLVRRHGLTVGSIEQTAGVDARRSHAAPEVRAVVPATLF